MLKSWNLLVEYEKRRSKLGATSSRATRQRGRRLTAPFFCCGGFRGFGNGSGGMLWYFLPPRARYSACDGCCCVPNNGVPKSTGDLWALEGDVLTALALLRCNCEIIQWHSFSARATFPALFWTVFRATDTGSSDVDDVKISAYFPKFYSTAPTGVLFYWSTCARYLGYPILFFFRMGLGPLIQCSNA